MKDEEKKELRKVIASGVFLGIALWWIISVLFSLINGIVTSCSGYVNTPLKDVPAKCLSLFLL